MNSERNAHASSRRTPTTVRGVAWNRFLDLGRDEGGAVFVVTLAFFFLMYLVCCGVYAVSTAVRERIQLQNACDAAAYSAAVVQADTLSRIATINRAMAWTYVQMTRRQMDYIVLKWLGHTVDHYNQDRRKAKEFNEKSFCCPLHKSESWCPVPVPLLPLSGGWYIGTGNSVPETVYLNGKATAISKVEGMTGKFSSLSLESKIQYDKRTIDSMNDAEYRLAFEMPKRIAETVDNVIDSNVPDVMKGQCQFFVRQCLRPLEKCFEYLRNNSVGEKRFVAFADYFDSLIDVFKGKKKNGLAAGLDQWFVRGNGARRTIDEFGLQRCYKNWPEAPTRRHLSRRPSPVSCVNELYLGESPRSVALFSEWQWWSIQWKKVTIPPDIELHLPKWSLSKCSHGHDDQCHVSSDSKLKKPETPEMKTIDSKLEKGLSLLMFLGLPIQDLSYLSAYNTGRARCYADEPEIYNGNYIGAKALPLVLRESYFGKDGTITVGIVRRNQNVWERILGAIDGVFRAFDPDWTGDVNSSKTFVFASAKAGYVDKTDDRAADAQRIDYRIDWQTGNQKWNLCQGNWDAVFVPVRMSNSMAVDGKWQDTDDRVLEDLIGNASWRSLDGNQPSGIGSWQEISAPRLMNGVEMKSMYIDGFSAEQGRVELQYVTDRDKAQNLNWRGLSRVLYH